MATELHDLSGYYTYRSFLDNPSPVNDFNKIKSQEAELFLIIQLDGTLTGTLAFPAEPGTLEKTFLDLSGSVNSLLFPIALKFRGQGRPNTTTFDLKYDYSCTVVQIWEDNDINQRLSLTGTVLKVQDNSSRNDASESPITSSFVAVKRDFVEPRDINGVAIIPSALSMLASKSHRLTHAVWHTLRLYQIWWTILDDPDKSKIRDLGWYIERPPFTNAGRLDLTNGAGEDFLFMHRKMIKMVKDEYKSQGVPYIESWKTLPMPTVQQFVYLEQDDPQNPGKKIYRMNEQESGYMIPPAYFISNGNESEQQDLERLKSLKFIKSSNYFTSIMRNLERQFSEPRYLSSLSLGALGNLVEFVIHNQMHNRWSSTPIDPTTGKPPLHPETGKPTGRESFDFNEKWDNPKYDYLGDFYSSHVNPVFWRLHGWVDDRIEEWFNAHEASHPGEIERYDYKGIPWFKPGTWVQASEPFYWPEHHHHNHHDHKSNDHSSVDNMLKVIEIIEKAIERRSGERTEVMRSFIRDKNLIMSFMRDIFPNI
jgi:hypothetical protein